MEGRLNDRRTKFKKRTDDPRRKREEYQLSLRKKERDEELQKKRQIKDENKLNIQDNDVNTENNQNVQEFFDHDDELGNIGAIRECLNSDNSENQYTAATKFRRLLSREDKPPIDQVLNADVVPRLVQLLGPAFQPKIQFEAAWALTNIASGTQEQTKVVIDSGAIPVFVSLLKSSDTEVSEQAIWALGNISGDSPECRNLVLQAGCLQPLLEIIVSGKLKPCSLRNATWALSNLCRGRPPPQFSEVAPSLPILKELIMKDDLEVLADACWALSYLSDGTNERIQSVLDAGVVERIVELLGHDNVMVKTPALRTVGNIVTGDEAQTQRVVDCNPMACLATMLYSPKKSIRKETCWTVSNITAGSKSQIQTVIDAGMIPILVNLLDTGEYEVRKEAAWAIGNAASGGSAEQIEVLVNFDCIGPLCELMNRNDPKMTLVSLEALENILRVGQAKQATYGLAENPYCTLIDHVGGVEAIEQMQDTTSEEVYQKAYRMILAFFPYDDNELTTEDMQGRNAPTELNYPITENLDFGEAQP